MMKKLLLLLLICSGFNYSNGQNIRPGEFILWFHSEKAAEEFFASSHGIGGTGIFFSKENKLAPSFPLWLCNANTTLPDETVLRYLRGTTAIRFAQHNHLLSERSTTPNDPDFTQQWDKHNTGQNGGTPDADIDAPEAWDITTGGLTSLGDTIVVAVIDGGFDLAHEDISFFKNYQEIPGNGQDDDNNGYTDDFDGWDAYTHDGDPNDPGGDHGTHVCGIIGAKGNNNTGIAGVNWNVKVMPVNGSSNSEATVVEAYSYVFEMRKLYNNTNGAKGAFVVSTNSSFGVDFGLPADYPIWCAMYDSLGAVGILSAGATANSNTDVDADGDIPTACSSDWLITVTNTTNTDQKNASAGYGLNTIDLGAPGTSVYSCLPGNTYGNLTGTSMATPQVAGAVALVYAAACSTFIQDYKNNPATYAMQVKNFIMEGVDTLPNLVASLHSGGRLNVFNSALKMVDFCSNGCYAPFGYAATQMTDSSGVITWADVAASDTFHIRWRPLGDTTWNYGTSMVPEYEIQGLSGCRPYEFEVESVCSGTPGGWSNTFVFYSEGCCVEPSGLSIVSADDTSAMVSWNGVYAATQYLLQYRPVGSPSWTDIIVSGDTLQITGLQNCTSYEWRIGSDCDTATSAYSSVMQFQTSGCGVCTDAPYCTGTGDPTFEWIESITIGPLQNASGNDNGYGDFTGAPLPFVSGTTMNVELVPGYSFFSFPDYWKIFLDVNADGDFDDAGEEIYSSGGTATGTVTGTAVIPAVVTPGISRLRVMQRFNTAPSPCDDQQFGEIEDYCVDLLLAASEELTTIPARAFPNPADGQLMIELPERGAYKIEILSLAGVTLLKTDASQAGITTLDVSGLSSGFYFVNIADQFSQTTLSFVKN